MGLVLGVLVQPSEEQSEEVERLQVLRLSWVVKTVHRMRGPCRKRRGEDAAIEAGDAQGGAPPHVAHRTGGEEVQDCFWWGLGVDCQL